MRVIKKEEEGMDTCVSVGGVGSASITASSQESVHASPSGGGWSEGASVRSSPPASCFAFHI